MLKVKKSKKIFYCIASFALVSLVTIGFSTWIISIEQPNQDFNVSINVDAMSFETVICDVELSKGDNASITLGPSNISDGGIVSGDGKSTEDLSASIEGNLIVANEMIDKIDCVTINLVSHGENNETDYNSVTIGENDPFGRNPGPYYYLTPSITEIDITSNSFTPYGVDGFKSVALTDLNNLTLKYGSYFENKDNPSDFYADKLQTFRTNYIKGKIEASEYLNAIKTAQSEIKTMQTNLKSLTIQIAAVVNEN